MPATAYSSPRMRRPAAAVTTITSLVQAQFGLVSAGRLPAISWAIKQGETGLLRCLPGRLRSLETRSDAP